jgi:imidazoleglycerol phosphate dehydratase HisB
VAKDQGQENLDALAKVATDAVRAERTRRRLEELRLPEDESLAGAVMDISNSRRPVSQRQTPPGGSLRQAASRTVEDLLSLLWPDSEPQPKPPEESDEKRE